MQSSRKVKPEQNRTARSISGGSPGAVLHGRATDTPNRNTQAGKSLTVELADKFPRASASLLPSRELQAGVPILAAPPFAAPAEE